MVNSEKPDSCHVVPVYFSRLVYITVTGLINKVKPHPSVTCQNIPKVETSCAPVCMAFNFIVFVVEFEWPANSLMIIERNKRQPTHSWVKLFLFTQAMF